MLPRHGEIGVLGLIGRITGGMTYCYDFSILLLISIPVNALIL